MNSVSKGQLKAKMLEYLRLVEKTGEELIITDNRKPVLRIVPIKERSTVREVFAKYQRKVGDEKAVLADMSEDWE